MNISTTVSNLDSTNTPVSKEDLFLWHYELKYADIHINNSIVIVSKSKDSGLFRCIVGATNYIATLV